mgnify:CR=1 FL=1
MALTRPRFTQLNTTVVTLTDTLTVLNGTSTTANLDVGFVINRDGGTTANTALFWDESANAFTTAFTTTSGASISNVSIAEYADIKVGTLFGNIGGGSTLPNVYVTGSLIPTSNVSYDLGTPTNRWREGWFSGSTIHIGDESISVDSNGKWTFTSAGAAVDLGKDAEFNPPTANISGNVYAGNFYFSNGTLLTSLVTSAITSSNNALKSYTDALVSTNISSVNSSIDGANTAIVTANIALKLYADTAISTNVASVNSSIDGANTAIVTANTDMKAYVDYSISQSGATGLNITSNTMSQSTHYPLFTLSLIHI